MILDPARPIRGLRDSKELARARAHPARGRNPAAGACLGDRLVGCGRNRRARHPAGEPAGHAQGPAGPRDRARPRAGRRQPLPLGSDARVSPAGSRRSSAATRGFAEISAASILAKTSRDAWMARVAADLPGLRLRAPQGLSDAGASAPAGCARTLPPAPAELRAGKIAACAELKPADPSPTFVHLRLHTEYSLVDGIVRVDRADAGGGGAGMPAVALTDQSNLFAMVKFYREAQRQGVKPVIGVDVWLREEGDRAEPSRLTLLAQNLAGYRNLTRLVSRSYLEGQDRGRPLLERAWLDAGTTAGLIALSGAGEGDVGRALAAWPQRGGTRAARRLARAVRRPLLPRDPAHRPGGRGRARRRSACARRASCRRRSSQPTMCASSRATSSRRTRPGSASTTARGSTTRAGRGAIRRSST